jgi:hypothetical protein
MHKIMKLAYAPWLCLALCLALCTMVVACGSASEGSDDDAQREEASAADAATADDAAVAPECMGRAQGEEFCDHTTVRACLDGIASTVQQCGEHRRCITVRDRVSCACEPGAVDTGEGCQAVASCDADADADQRGCDRLTECSIVAGKRTCGACPAGYGGDGERGCAPLLSGLVAEGGELSPDFSPDVRSYHVKLPQMREQFSLTPSAPSEAQLELDGEKLSPGSTWSSPVVSGERTIVLVLTGPNGITTQYEIIVERAEP